jgi:arginase
VISVGARLVCEPRSVTAALIEVPAMAGDPSHPAAAGPATLTAALAMSGYRPTVHRVPIPAFAGNVAAASRAVCRATADAVRAVAADGQRPIVLAGSCDIAPAVLAGLGGTGCGVVWIDAHADYNTPASSASGFWPGITLAAVVGDCGTELWAALGARPVDQSRVALFGVRSLSPAAEARRLRRSRMQVVPWRGGRPQADVVPVLDRLAAAAQRVYLHLDLDALDPSVGCGVADPPVPGGLSAAQLTELLENVRRRLTIAAATIATYTPANDDGSTLPIATTAIRQLAE